MTSDSLRFIFYFIVRNDSWIGEFGGNTLTVRVKGYYENIINTLSTTRISCATRIS